MYIIIIVTRSEASLKNVETIRIWEENFFLMFLIDTSRNLDLSQQ